MLPRRPHKEQFGKGSCKIGTAHKSKAKKRSKAGKKGIRRQHSGMKSKSWRRSWNEEGWKEAPCSWRLCERYLSKWCMHACHKAKV